MSRIRTALAAAFLTLPAIPALAESAIQPSDTLQIYAAMAKLEANKAEAAGAVMLAAAPDVSEEVAEEAREDFASDAAQIEEYFAILDKLPLTDEQAAALGTFKDGWREAVTTASAILESGDRQAAFDWWESLDGLDDVIDDQLEEILEDNGVALAG